jgi:hypothetical protein
MTIDRHAQLKALQLHGMAAAWQEYPQGTSGGSNSLLGNDR